MFSKQQASLLKQQFWTSFGRYMAPVPASDGSRINWVNYKTGVKDLFFTLQADNRTATIAITAVHKDPEKQSLVFNQLLQLKGLLRVALQEDWEWALQQPDEYNKTVSRIYLSRARVNIYKQEDWPAIISFFKPRLIALDAFWTDVRDGFML